MLRPLSELRKFEYLTEGFPFIVCAGHKRTGKVHDLCTFATEEAARRYCARMKTASRSHEHFTVYKVPADDPRFRPNACV